MVFIRYRTTIYNCAILFSLLGMQLLILQPGVKQQEADPPSMKALISDPYIIMAAGKYY